jgi:hypothetical protein
MQSAGSAAIEEEWSAPTARRANTKVMKPLTSQSATKPQLRDRYSALRYAPAAKQTREREIACSSKLQAAAVQHLVQHD